VYNKIDSVMFNGHDFFISFNFGMFMTVKLTLFCMKVDFLKKNYNLLSNDQKICFFFLIFLFFKLSSTFNQLQIMKSQS
jgi:hypothetical protein